MNIWQKMFGGSETTADGLPDIYPFTLAEEVFVKGDILATYTKILTDVIERTSGLDEKKQKLMWDNCVQTSANEGLITLLGNAMYQKSELFLVYVPSVNILRRADSAEIILIRKDYKEKGESSVGVFISFSNYRRTDLLKVYSALEYCATASLYKTVNLAKAVQIKIDGLRQSTALVDSKVATDQAVKIAAGLKGGKDVLLDAKDIIETAQIDTAPTEKAISFIDSKRAYILSLPVAYTSGVLTAGIGSTGEADMREIERGLKQYFESIVKPTLDALFKIQVSFKSQDFRLMTSALEALRTFGMTDDELLDTETKIEIVAELFDRDPAELKARIEKQAKDKPVANTPPATNQNFTAQPQPQAASGSGGN